MVVRKHIKLSCIQQTENLSQFIFLICFLTDSTESDSTVSEPCYDGANNKSVIVACTNNIVGVGKPSRAKCSTAIISKQKKLKSIQAKQMTLYVSPQLDNSDSNIYLPSLIAKMTNSLDFDGLHKILTNRSSPNCLVEFKKHDKKFTHDNYRMILTLIQFLTEKYPDLVLYPKKTKVIGNKIRATLVMKHTDVQSMNDAILQSNKWQMFNHHNSVSCNRADKYISMMDLTDKTPEDIMALKQLISSHQNLQVSAIWEMSLFVDPLTNKITRYELRTRILTVEPLETNFSSTYT